MTTSENTTSKGVDENVITQRLEELGFERLSRSADGNHVLLRRDHINVVVPGSQRIVPPKVAEMIERSLEAVLGPKWLVQSDNAESLVYEDIVVLDVVVLEPSDDDLWRAFLVDELSTVGYANSRSGALSDLKAAAALRIGRKAEHIVLVTPDIL